MRQHLVRCVKCAKFSGFRKHIYGKLLLRTSNHKMLQTLRAEICRQTFVKRKEREKNRRRTGEEREKNDRRESERPQNV